ncbi:hypothetical protein G6F46_013456 [Rhizopus delemar]|nr:hypothetical protein G6F46_013456 [Rhizopus delemar]
MKFTNAPEFSGALNVEYRTELANGSNLSARVSYSYQSEVWPTTDLSPVIRQDGYGLVNAGVIWRLDDAWTFSLQGTNLTDKEYRTTGYNIPAVGTLIGFYGPPRQYSLSSYVDLYWNSDDGLRLHARDHAPDTGQAARGTVVCIPGLTRNGADFDALAGILTAVGWRVIAVDLRGRAGSERAHDPTSTRRCSSVPRWACWLPSPSPRAHRI